MVVESIRDGNVYRQFYIRKQAYQAFSSNNQLNCNKFHLISSNVSIKVIYNFLKEKKNHNIKKKEKEEEKNDELILHFPSIMNTMLLSN